AATHSGDLFIVNGSTVNSLQIPLAAHRSTGIIISRRNGETWFAHPTGIFTVRNGNVEPDSRLRQ
ncbi:MAG: hypothetical protein V4616_01720, partial [Bacteroidota bacterium]